MATQIRVQNATKTVDRNCRCNVYSVEISDHRILTVVTESDDVHRILSKWLKEVLKSSPNTNFGDITIVGLSVDQVTGGHSTGIDLLSLCVGSHCLLYLFPPIYDADKFTSKSLNAFFGNPRVVAVALNAVSLTKNLEKLHKIKIKNAVDVRDVLHRVRPELINYHNSDLDYIAERVIGREMIIDRPEKKEIQRYTRHWSYYWINSREEHTLSNDKIKYSTLDSYLCFLIFSKSRLPIDEFNGKNKNLKQGNITTEIFCNMSPIAEPDEESSLAASQSSSSSATPKNRGKKKKKKKKAAKVNSKSVINTTDTSDADQLMETTKKLSKNKKRKVRKRQCDIRDRTVFVGVWPDY